MCPVSLDSNMTQHTLIIHIFVIITQQPFHAIFGKYKANLCSVHNINMQGYSQSEHFQIKHDISIAKIFQIFTNEVSKTTL